MLTFKQLEAVYWVAELGTFAAAAERLYTSESAISKRIGELEKLFAVALFDRSHRTARLTRQGREMLEYARDILQSRDRLVNGMGKADTLVRRYRVGVTELISLTWLPELLKLFQSRYPGIAFEPEIDLSPVLWEKLNDGMLDLIIVPPVFHGPRAVAVPLKKLALSWMCRPDMMQGQDPVPLREIARFPIIAQSGRSGVDAVYEQWFRTHEVPIRKVYSGNSLISLAALTMSGLGVSYLPALYFMDLVEQGRLRVFRSAEPNPDIPYYAVYRADDGIGSFNAAVAKLCAALCDFSKPVAGPTVYRADQPGSQGDT
jgi:DNA-binding transcriptional LysR family regulator